VARISKSQAENSIDAMLGIFGADLTLENSMIRPQWQ
jgi:hypothetical protein